MDNSTQLDSDMTGDRGRIMPDDASDSSVDSYGSKDITLDKSVPEIADAFEGCKVGDTYVVKSDDDMNLVLSKQASNDDANDTDNGPEPDTDLGGDKAGDESMPKSDNPAIAVLIARKKKQ